MAASADARCASTSAAAKASTDVGDRMRAAGDEVGTGGQARTADMGGNANTKEFTDALVRALD